MGEIRFYRLEGEGPGAILPTLVERSLARGQRVLITDPDPAAREALSARLWSYNDISFLAHGHAGQGHEADQPVLLSGHSDAPNNAPVHILTGTARVDLGVADHFEMTVRLFDGTDGDVLTQARDDWRAVTAAGKTAVFWAKEGGKWLEKARSG
ncbi:MAG: DNA polymerase III subunit chi [Pseudomonadota bacterium]